VVNAEAKAEKAARPNVFKRWWRAVKGTYNRLFGKKSEYVVFDGVNRLLHGIVERRVRTAVTAATRADGKTTVARLDQLVLPPEAADDEGDSPAAAPSSPQAHGPPHEIMGIRLCKYLLKLN
jgi:hypothetical protein